MKHLLAALLIWLGLALPGFAQSVSDAERAEFQRIITAQLEAFRADRDAEAYGYAAPNIQMIFPSVDSFMGMVKKGYPQVYRPRSYKFLSTELDPAGRPTQRALIIGPDGKAYTALYTMQLQPDGTWKIAACVILREAGLDA